MATIDGNVIDESLNA